MSAFKVLAEHVGIITIDNIIVKERLRPLRDDAVVDLMESMREIGLINPITIWRPDGRVVPELVSGAHRLEAARRLGWSVITDVPAVAKINLPRDLRPPPGKIAAFFLSNMASTTRSLSASGRGLVLNSSQRHGRI